MSTIHLHQTTTSTPEQYVARGSHYRWTGRPEAASALLQDVVGKAKSPCPLVYGVASLPLGAPVELEVRF